MCGVLINIFSGYGIFNLAVSLSAKYLSNFQKCIDYRATSRTLDLIWTIDHKISKKWVFYTRFIEVFL